MTGYCLHITDIEPMKYALVFERFLNPERVSMPDFDIDFCPNRRGEMLDYVARRYGADHVAQIVTFGTMAARGAIRDVGRAMNFTYAEADVVAKLVPSTLHITLDEALKVSSQLRGMYDSDERVRKLIDTARSIEGMPRNTSTHAAGVVITAQPVYDYVPLSRNDETIVTQYPMTTLEELGLLKMDFLGLRNLTVIRDAEKAIQKVQPDFRMDDVAEDDPETLRMLSEGKTAGVFQLESAGITGVCVGIQPESIEDLTAIVALYRPGPMDSIPKFTRCKRHPEEITYRTPQLEPILSVTYGCLVYQEQVIEVFRQLAGYTMGQADNIRRAMSKKKHAVIEAERTAFVHGDPSRGIPGAIARGVSEAAAEQIYDEVLDFANYAFNKAHAVCYAKVCYQTAWLKCHWPQQYMAALLTSVLDSSTKVSEYISACRDMGIEVLPPDVNISGDDFTVAGDSLRFGMAAVKNVGKGLTQRVVAEREAHGPYQSLEDFLDRMYGADFNKRAAESFIKCGALDCFGLRRSQMLEIYSSLMDTIADAHRRNVSGQIDLFGTESDAPALPRIAIPDIPELPPQTRMAMEKETTGLYLSGHPMDDYREQLRDIPHIAAILEDAQNPDGPQQFYDGMELTIAGIVQTVRQKTTKNHSLMAYVTLEDSTASMELLVFSRTLDRSGSDLTEGQDPGRPREALRPRRQGPADAGGRGHPAGGLPSRRARPGPPSLPPGARDRQSGLPPDVRHAEHVPRRLRGGAEAPGRQLGAPLHLLPARRAAPAGTPRAAGRAERRAAIKKGRIFMAVTLNPDASIVETVREGLRHTGGYCPCRLERTPENKCICAEFRAQMADPDFEGFCHCMLYYKSRDEKK